MINQGEISISHTHPDSLPQFFKQNAWRLRTAGGGRAEVRDHSCSLQLAHLAVTSAVCFFQLGPGDTSPASQPPPPGRGGGGITVSAAASQSAWLSVLLDAGCSSEGGIPASAWSRGSVLSRRPQLAPPTIWPGLGSPAYFEKLVYREGIGALGGFGHSLGNIKTLVVLKEEGLSCWQVCHLGKCKVGACWGEGLSSLPRHCDEDSH